SPYLDVRVSLQQPGFLALSLDGLGEGKPGPNALRPPVGGTAYDATRGMKDGRVWLEYYGGWIGGLRGAAAPGWRFEIGNRELRLVSQFSADERPEPLLLNFDPERCHV